MLYREKERCVVVLEPSLLHTTDGSTAAAVKEVEGKLAEARLDVKHRKRVYLAPNEAGYAAAGGHLGVLQWARTQDPPCPLDERTCTRAAAGGHLGVLQWLRAQDPPCPWDAGTCVGAASHGHLGVRHARRRPVLAVQGRLYHDQHARQTRYKR